MDLELSSYPVLITTLKKEIQETENKLKLSLEKEKVRLYWKMGQHISTHLLNNQDKPDFGKGFYVKLSRELNIDRSLLQKMVKFYKEFLNWDTYPNLTWSHFVALLPVKDRKKQESLMKQVTAESLSVRELKELIIIENKTKKPIPEQSQENIKLLLVRGVPYVYKIKEISRLNKSSRIIVDAGFNFIPNVGFANLNDFTPSNIVQVKKNKNRYVLKKSDVPVSQIYTYKAEIEKILDSDTFWAILDLGFNILVRQKIRLHKLDGPPIETEEGQKAFEYLEKRLKPCDFVVIKTHWRDKFDRYLSDVFYTAKEQDFLTVIEKGRFLNQELVDKGFCKVVSG